MPDCNLNIVVPDVLADSFGLAKSANFTKPKINTPPALVSASKHPLTSHAITL